MDQAVAQPYIDQVNDAVTQAETLAQSVSDPTLQRTLENATAQLRRAETNWSTEQLQQTWTHDRTDDNWQQYGTGDDSGSLLNQAKRFIRDNGSVYAQFSNAINKAGNAAQAIESWVQANIAQLRAALEGYKTQLAAFDQQQLSVEKLNLALSPVKDKLPAEMQDYIFGTTGNQAANNVQNLHTLIEKAESMISALESGAAAVFHSGDVMLQSDVESSTAPQSNSATSSSDDSSSDDSSSNQSVDASANGLMTLGQLQVAGMFIAGIVGLLGVIGAYCLWQEGYYQHTAQVAKYAQVNHLLDIISSPTASSQAKKDAQAALDALDKEHPPDPLSSFGAILTEAEQLLATAAKVGAAVAVVTVVYVYREPIKLVLTAAYEAVKKLFGRKTNPRKRRRNKARRKRRAYA